MLNPIKVIRAVNKATKPFLLDNGMSFSLSQYKTSNLRLIMSNDISTAYNNYGNGGEHVKVIKWFADFWLFVEIQFLNPSGTNVSLSIFQGKETDANKTQLFRAEWDDYEDSDNTHAQPHWHFLTNKLVESNAKNFAQLLAEEKETFEAFLDEEISKSVDLSKFHFAMNADWVNSKLHVHKIDDENVLATWFGGLLAYLKTELEYVAGKRSASN